MSGTTRSSVESSTNDIGLAISEISDLIRSKQAVPTELVYPLFSHLGNLWIVLYEVNDFLLSRRDVVWQALKSKDPEFSCSLTASQVSEAMEHHAVEEAQVSSSSIATLASSSNCVLVTRQSHGDQFDQLPVYYRGYCPVTLVDRAGLLMPGDPSLGLIRFEDQYYACMTKDAIKIFMNDPKKCVKSLKFVVLFLDIFLV